MDDRMRSTLLLLVCAFAAAAQPLPDGAVARFAPAPGEPAYTGCVRAALSPDGKTVATADDAGRLDLWDVSGKRQRRLAYAGPRGTTPRWAPDGRRLFAGHSRGLAVWDTASPDAPPRVLPSHLETTAGPDIVVAPDGRTVVAAWPFPMIVCWDTDSGAERWRAHTGGGLGVSRDGRQVVRGWFGQRFEFLDAATGHPVGRYGPDLVECKPACSDRFVLSPDGRYLAGWAEKGVVVLRDPRTGEERRRIATGQEFGIALAFSPDGHWLATGGKGSALQVWEADTGELIGRRTGHDRPVMSVDFTPDGRRALTASGDGTALLWDLSPARAADRAGVWELAADPDGPARLRAELPPAPRLDPAVVDRLIADLDANRHAVRERATRALADHGRAALPALNAALARRPSAEAAARLEKLIRDLPDHLTPAEVAHRRAVKAMSLAGTAAARELLAEWAAGAPGAVLTDEARAALDRFPSG
jgi:hypothetical protein